MYAAIWAECVWQVADASQSATKFIVADNRSAWLTATASADRQLSPPADDPDIHGTHTVFPLTLDKVLILTDRSWARMYRHAPPSTTSAADHGSRCSVKIVDSRDNRLLTVAIRRVIAPRSVARFLTSATALSCGRRLHGVRSIADTALRRAENADAVDVDAARRVRDLVDGYLEVLRPGEVAALLRILTSTIGRLIRLRQVPATEAGGRWRLRKNALLEFLADAGRRGRRTRSVTRCADHHHPALRHRPRQSRRMALARATPDHFMTHLSVTRATPDHVTDVEYEHASTQ